MKICFIPALPDKTAQSLLKTFAEFEIVSRIVEYLDFRSCRIKYFLPRFSTLMIGFDMILNNIRKGFFGFSKIGESGKKKKRDNSHRENESGPVDQGFFS